MSRGLGDVYKRQVQGTAEGDPFDEETLGTLIRLAKNGIKELMKVQNQE